jgi:protein ImuB
MAFASIHVSQMLLQAVMRNEPHLRAGRLVLVDGTPPLVRVVAASDSALAAGIQTGMAKSQAAQFPGVEIRHRAPAQEKAAHAALLDLGWSISPRVENAAPDTVVLDLAGLNSLFGSDQIIAQELLSRAALLGLAANIAVAASIDVAIVASRGFSGVTVLAPGEEATRLGLLSVAVLLPSAEFLETLDRWGIRTCRDLAALPPLDLSERLGQEGVRLHQLAGGSACRSLVLAEPGVHFEEELDLDTPEEELEPVSFLLGRLLDQLCSRLQARSLAVTAIHLKFILFDLFEKDPEIISKNSAPGVDPKIYTKCLTLPVAMRDSKMLLKLLRLQLQADPPPGSVIKIILSADPARRRAAQTGLFVPSSPDPEKFDLTVARLAKLVGENNLGSPELVDSHRPGQFRMARFIPPSPDNRPQRKNKPGPSKMPSAVKNTPQNEAGQGSISPPRRSSQGFRVFRPRLPVKIELRDERPGRIFFRGVYGQITAVSGPWRTSGDWWNESAWLHDEWDIEVRLNSSSAPHHKVSKPFRPEIVSAASHQALPATNGIYCVYFDAIAQSWFVRGMYD